MRHRHLIATAALALLGTGFAAPTVEAQNGLQSRDGLVHVANSSTGLRVVDRRGTSTPVDLPEDVVLEDLAAMRTGWLLAGRERRGAETELYLRRLDAGGLRNYPVPRRGEARERSSPVVLTRDGELAGMVWLEGDDRESYAVMASRWLGITWSKPATVAPGNDGAQLALDATTLADGSWLLVWAGWDGEDDEIFISVVTAEGSTSPVALTENAVPDLLPTVLATPDGALLAWNTFDGNGYRIATQRLVEGRWGDTVALEATTYYPFLIRHEETVHLLYLAQRPTGDAWVVADLDTDGRVAHRRHVLSDDPRRPVLLVDDARSELLFPADGRRAELIRERQP